MLLTLGSYQVRQQLRFVRPALGGRTEASGREFCPKSTCRFVSAVLSERLRPGKLPVRGGVYSSHFLFKRLLSFPQ